MSWNPSLSLNPELLRSLRVTLPRRRALFVAGLTLALLAAVAWIIWNRTAPYTYDFITNSTNYNSEVYHLKKFGYNSFVVVTVALFALLFLLGPAMAGLSFVQERLRGTAVFQQMTLLSPFKLAAGKFWGAGLLAYFCALLLLPFALAAAWLGGVDALMVARVLLFLLVGGFCWQAVGLYCSAALCGPSERALRGGLLVGPLIAVGGAVTAVGLNWFFTADYEAMSSWLSGRGVLYRDIYTYRQYEFYWWHFYGARVPAYAVVLGLLAFAGVWAFAGAVRRLKVWQLVPVGPQAAWYFFLTAAALVVGLLWGRHVDDTQPVDRLQLYMLLCWASVALFAGGSALTRGRLREWWSAERDPLALLQRSEIRGSVETLLFIVSTSLVGLFALWFSYHVDPSGNRFGYNFGTQFLPVALCFVLTLAATAFFVQFCAMFRFRVGGWAGVALLVVFYAFAGVAGVMLEGRANTATLVNPLAYSEVVTKGDYFIDSTFNSEVRDHLGSVMGSNGVNYFYNQQVWMPTDYTYTPADPSVFGAGATLRGLAAEGGLALLCFSLLFLKWGRTRREMLRERAA